MSIQDAVIETLVDIQNDKIIVPKPIDNSK